MNEQKGTDNAGVGHCTGIPHQPIDCHHSQPAVHSTSNAHKRCQENNWLHSAKTQYYQLSDRSLCPLGCRSHKLSYHASLADIMCSISLKSCMTKPKLRRLNLQEEKEYMPCDECPTTKTKGVFFAFVQVREHSRILGDHPSVSFGPPITLSWEVESDEIFSVDMYESVRDLYRRSRQQFLVPAAIRVRCYL